VSTLSDEDGTVKTQTGIRGPKPGPCDNNRGRGRATGSETTGRKNSRPNRSRHRKTLSVQNSEKGGDATADYPSPIERVPYVAGQSPRGIRKVGDEASSPNESSA